ncbi:uncharacterized protein LOC103573721 [Microplitis demolitor]|uniref:uncharacterized protein LOC103573721 n=1 Tax=Microplitis demolitor TaxID=69319 RepID=UPI0004CD6DE8|nr:uncharacterized protein LOC103573721 [Microplitis demolitor]
MTPNLVDTVYRNPFNNLTAPIIILDDAFLAKDIQLYYPAYPTYVLSADTQEQLVNLITKIRKSPLWNTASVFYIIGNTDQSCRKALQMTYTLWQFKCLSSFVICQAMTDRSFLFTLNPFTDRAPYPWVKHGVKVPNSRLSLYGQLFINDKQLCDVLNFDKTQFLDGYNVKLHKRVPGKDFFDEYVFPRLNITPIISYGDDSEKFLLANRFYDISGTLVCLDATDNRFVDIVPGFVESSYAIVTQKRSFLSLFNQILSVFDVNDINALFIILILFIIVIMLGNEYQIVPAFMDVFKLLLRMAIDAQLFAILTRPSSYDVETLQDLHDYQYHVYYHSSLHDDMMRTEIWTTVEEIKYLHPDAEVLPGRCFERASVNNTVACIYNTPYVLRTDLKVNLRVLKKFLFKVNYVHWARKEWPLKKRIDQQTLRAIESGFGEIIARRSRNTLKKMKTKERLKKILNYDEVDAIDLEYAYIFFAFIQLLAIIIFGIEHIIARWLHPRL